MNTEPLAIETQDLNEYEATEDGPPEGSNAGGPRRPRVHNARFLGSRAYALVPAKTVRQLRNRAQRQARKANRA